MKRERIKISTSINVSAAFAFSNKKAIMCNKLLRSPKKSSPSCAAFAFSNTLLLAGEKAVSCGVSNESEIDELIFIKELHLRTVQELGLDRSVLFNSGSSSSESSSGGIFSSSEAETSSGGRSCFTPHRSKYVPVAASAGSERSGKVADLAEQRDSAPKLAEKHRGNWRRSTAVEAKEAASRRRNRML